MRNKLVAAAMAVLLSIVVFTGCKKSSDDDNMATCSDGIQNQSETGIDCGGPCTACATCSDGIKNQGEAGIDCGGPCDACPSFSATVAGLGYTADTFFVDLSSVSGTTGYRIYGRNSTAQTTIDIYINAVNATHTITEGTEYNLASLPAGVTIPIMKYLNTTTTFPATSGKLKFTDIDVAKGRASGPFNFNGFNGTTVTITNGIFTNVPME